MIYRWTGLLLFMGLLFVFSGTAQGDAQGPYLYSWADPPVIWNDGTTTFTLQVATTNVGNAGVTSVTYTQPDGTLAQLSDDGKTNGDLKAGDGIYTLNTARLRVLPLSMGGVLDVVTLSITITTADGKSQSNYATEVGLVGVGLQFPSMKLKGVRVTKNAIFVTVPAWTPASGFSSSDQQGAGLGLQQAFLRRATHSVYAVLPDAFDFIVAMPGHQLLDAKGNYGEGTPFFVRGRNAVQNIGLPPFDAAKTYGSKGRLLGVVYQSFGLGSELTHEFGHNWAAFTGKTQNLSNCDNCYGPHWNNNSDIGGVMGGRLAAPGLYAGTGSLSANPDGTWRLAHDPTNPNGSYSMLDLYLMGLVPSSAVPPIHLLTNPNLSNINKVTAQSVSTYNVLDLTGAERVPSTQSAPKKFSTAFVIMKEKSFTPAEMAFFSLLAQQYTQSNAAVPVLLSDTYLNPFARATGGLASMSADLPVAGLTPPSTSYYSILNDADGMPGPLAPGSMFDVLVTFSNAVMAADPKSVVYTLNQASIQLDGAPVRLYSINYKMIVGAIPQNASTGVHTLTVKAGNSVVLTQQITIIGRNSAAYTWSPDPMHENIRAPRISDMNGTMVGDPSLLKNYVQAKAGDTLVITATGCGPTVPALDDSAAVLPPGSFAFVPEQVGIDGKGLDPSTLSGFRAVGSFSIDTVKFVVPAGLASGPHSVQLGSTVYANGLWIK